MPRYLILMVLMAGILHACKSDESIKGKAFIPQETFVEVLVDLHMVDGITNDRKFYRKYTEVDSIDLLSPILDKYQLTWQQFDTTMYAYTQKPELFDVVYNEVIMQLNMKLDALDEEEGGEASREASSPGRPADRE